ncbi:Alkaline phosphatase [Microcystis panniformis FACHB-1757]|uniref:Alkaline phosphatase n=1 Tax=Microcystis panniformis FACHB-1757 TaxID=1638788 RepID=A0A0K1S8X9_9CHRO|nr:Alkaline phosphatase [Microcystis panniformis FACHB-1757]
MPPLLRGIKGGTKGGSAPPLSSRVDSFKLSTANFESINLTEDSQVYLFLIKIVSHNN